MEGKGPDNDVSKAELFEAMGHPTRIRLLQSLAGGPLGFSELKHALGVESNGLLAFHLGKMGEFVKENPEGKYALTDYGTEALRLSHVLEEPGRDDGRPLKVSRPKIGFGLTGQMLLGGLAVALVVIAALAGLLYLQNQDQVARNQQLNNQLIQASSSIANLQNRLATNNQTLLSQIQALRQEFGYLRETPLFTNLTITLPSAANYTTVASFLAQYSGYVVINGTASSSHWEVGVSYRLPSSNLTYVQELEPDTNKIGGVFWIPQGTIYIIEQNHSYPNNQTATVAATYYYFAYLYASNIP